MPEQRLSVTKDAILSPCAVEACWENSYCRQRVGGERNGRFPEESVLPKVAQLVLFCTEKGIIRPSGCYIITCTL